MKVLPKPVSFEWDKGNSEKNWHKHGVTNQEAEEVFINKLSLVFEDQKHSLEEKRYMVWGTTKKGRKLSIIFTVRKSHIRIISARDISLKERRKYEQET